MGFSRLKCQLKRKKIDTVCFWRFSKFQLTRKWVNKVNLLTNFSTQNLVQILACVISTRKAKHTDVTTMLTYSHANTPIGQSERAYYMSYFIQQFMQCVTLLLIYVDTGLQELYLPLLVMGIHCTMWWVWKDNYYASWSSWKWEYQWSWDKPYCLCCKQWCPMLQFGWEQICVEDVHFKTLSLKWQDFCHGLEHTV